MSPVRDIDEPQWGCLFAMVGIILATAVTMGGLAYLLMILYGMK